MCDVVMATGLDMGLGGGNSDLGLQDCAATGWDGTSCPELTHNCDTETLHSLVNI